MPAIRPDTFGQRIRRRTVRKLRDPGTEVMRRDRLVPVRKQVPVIRARECSEKETRERT